MKEFGECSKEFHEKRKQFYKDEHRKPGVAIVDDDGESAVPHD